MRVEISDPVHRAGRTFLALAILVVATAAIPSNAADHSRTIVAGGSLTEIIYALGAADRLVAVDTTSLYPPAAQELESIGYLRQLSAEPILSMRPTLLIVESDAGPVSALEQIASTGVEVVKVDDDTTVEGVLEKIRVVANTLELQAEGEALSGRLRASMDNLLGDIGKANSRPRVLFLLSVGRGSPLGAGNDTSAQSIIELAGGVNALEGFDGYKPVSTESIVAADPEVLLVTTRTAESLGGTDQILSRVEIAMTTAGRERRLVVMDDLLLLGFGPRIDQAVQELAVALHPDLGLSRITATTGQVNE